MGAGRAALPWAKETAVRLSSPRLHSSRSSAAASLCLFCSLATSASRKRRTTRYSYDGLQRRHQSATAGASTPRKELAAAIIELDRRLPGAWGSETRDLAIEGLRQGAGEETVRVAILAVGSSDGGFGAAAKSVTRLLLADPLQSEESWEKELEDHDLAVPLHIEVGKDNKTSGTISTVTSIPQVHISSPELNGRKLQILVASLQGNSNDEEGATPGASDIQTSEYQSQSPSGRTALPQMPVHKSILLAEGLNGALALVSQQLPLGDSSIIGAVDLQGFAEQKLDPSLEVIDSSLAEKAVQLFRQGPQHGIEYERLWFSSRLPVLLDFIRSGCATARDSTKPAVRHFLALMLEAASRHMETEEFGNTHRKNLHLTASRTVALSGGLEQWAQSAHAELQSELDLAFTGRPWRKLGWWKLFWRVDDVAMLTTEMLSQKFLPTAERELVYLTGRIANSDRHVQYSQPSRQPQELQMLASPGEIASTARSSDKAAEPALLACKWPDHISFSRRLLQNETVPGLQALAQKLVMQSLATSGAMTSLGALLYVSAFASTLYEAGAFAALGIMYSLARMQKKWEKARGYWEGEVREEGRKAVRDAEASVANALKGNLPPGAHQLEKTDYRKARELLAKAQDALARMK